MSRRTRSRLDRDIDRYLATPPPAGKFTVLVKNRMTGNANHVGTFDDEAAAVDYALREIGRARKFVDYELWTGSAQRPGRHVRDLGSGTQ